MAFFFFFLIILNFALGRNRTRDPRVPEPKRTPLGHILPKKIYIILLLLLLLLLHINVHMDIK
jgi:hypothetical protein